MLCIKIIFITFDIKFFGMKLRFLTAMLFLLFINILSSQNLSPCATGTEPLCKCNSAPLLTDQQLDLGIEFDMTSYQHPVDGPTPMCPPPFGSNTTSTNPTWVSFIATRKLMIINLINTNCTKPNTNSEGGVQAALYSACPATPANAVFCNTEISACNGDGSRTLYIDNLEIGKQYYLLIDGCGNSACHIQLQSNICSDEINVGKENIIRIGGVVWREDNQNMIYDGNDSGLKNYHLKLHNRFGDIIDSTVTDFNGNYLFSGVKEGCYYVTFDKTRYKSTVFSLESCGAIKPDSGVDHDNNLIKINQSSILASPLLTFVYPDQLSDTIVDKTTDFCLQLICKEKNPIASSTPANAPLQCDFLNLNQPQCKSLQNSNPNLQQTIKYKDKIILLHNPDFISFAINGIIYVGSISLDACISGDQKALFGIIDAEKDSCIVLDTLSARERYNFQSTNFAIGRQYYFFISGIDGDLCQYDYSFDTGGESILNDLKIESQITGNVLCVNENANIYVKGNDKLIDSEFIWEIKNNTTGVVAYDTTTVSQITVSHNEVGQYSVRVLKAQSKCVGFYGINSIFEYSVENSSTCEKLIVEVEEVKDVSCEAKGFINLNIQNGNPPIKFYDNDIEIESKNDSLFFENPGFKKIKIVENGGFSRTYEVFVGGDSLFSQPDLVPTFVLNSWQRGIEHHAWINLTNRSCQAIDVKLSMELPSEMKYLSSEILPWTIDGNIITWKLDSFLGKITIPLKLKVLQIATLDSKLNIKISSLPVENDHRPQDNIKIYSGIVTGSYDPNDKQSYPPGICEANYHLKNEKIEYTIRFQNIGTAAARNVLVVDPIDQYHDINSVEILAASHPFYLLKAEGKLEFHFKNISLPPLSQDSALCNGFIVFSIYPKNDGISPAQTYNSALIYFDENQAIQTNGVYYNFVDVIPNYELGNVYTCQGDAYILNGIEYKADTTYIIEKINFDGCKVIEKITIELLKEKLTILSTDSTISCVEYFDKYIWVDCNDASKQFETLDSVFVPPYFGEFKVFGLSNDCKWQSECIPFTVSSKDIYAPYVNIYPNPSLNGELTIESYQNNMLNVSISSMDGKKSIASKLEKDSQNWKVKVNQSGIFIVSVSTMNGTVNKIINISN